MSLKSETTKYAECDACGARQEYEGSYDNLTRSEGWKISGGPGDAGLQWKPHGEFQNANPLVLCPADKGIYELMMGAKTPRGERFRQYVKAFELAERDLQGVTEHP